MTNHPHRFTRKRLEKSKATLLQRTQQFVFKNCLLHFILVLLFSFGLGNDIAWGQSLGTYPSSTVIAGQNTSVTPNAAPSNATRIVAYCTNTNFNGVLTVNTTTGVVRVTAALKAGSYTITVKAFGSSTTTATFTLTVSDPTCSLGTFAGTTEITVGGNNNNIAIGDFNGDGVQDLAIPNLIENTVSIRIGDGMGGFTNKSDLSIPQARWISIGDFNGDGKQDLAIASYNGNYIAIRLGDGTGAFSGTTNVSVGNEPTGIAIGDFNRDGKQDFASTSLNGRSLNIRLGDGTGAFSSTNNYSLGSEPRNPVIGDFNGDGYPDLAVAMIALNQVFIGLGDGMGSFSVTTPVSVGKGPANIALGDFNSDGNQDFATANIDSNTVSIRLGNGMGGFTGKNTLSVGTQTRTVAIGDFNGDGKQDIAAAGSGTGTGANSVGICLGNGNGYFSSPSYVSVVTQPLTISVGDFNGDGVQDFVAGNNLTSSASIRLGSIATAAINVQGNGTDIADGDTSPSIADDTDFGAVSSALARTFTIQNKETTALTISSIVSSNAHFSISGAPTSVAAGSSQTFQVIFTPTTPDVQNATITINSNVCNTGAYTFDVTALGSCPTFSASPGSAIITNSTCNTGCILAGGTIAAPSGSCPMGSAIQYKVDNGAWSSTLPTYNQSTAQLIKTRCVCTADLSVVSDSSAVTTVPGVISNPVVPQNGASTVACLASVTPPTPPMVMGCDGSTLTLSGPSIVDNPSSITCEGIRTYTYTYSCGTGSSTWSYVYTIEREPFTVPADGALTVACPIEAIQPTPPTVLSNCGETLNPTGPVVTTVPNPLVADGTKTYTWTYTDCEGNTTDWKFVYTIQDLIPPSITCPENIEVCEGDTVLYTPPVGTDNCAGVQTTQYAGLASGIVYPVGTTTNSFRVQAANGATATCSFTVTVNPAPTVSTEFLNFMCTDSTITLSSTINGGTTPYVSYSWTQTGAGLGSVLITDNNDGTATAKGVTPGKVYIEMNVVDDKGCSALTNAKESLIVVDCASFSFANLAPNGTSNVDDYMIQDPCTCKGSGLFSETVWLAPTSVEQIWTVFSIVAARAGGSSPRGITAGDALTFRDLNGIVIHEITFDHVDSSGYAIVVEGPNPPGSQGNVFLSIDNICYYPDVALNDVPVLVSPHAAPFVITGIAANGATGIGTFTLNGILQAGASPAPTQLTIYPASLPLYLNTLEYSFDADTSGAKNLSDPGCVKATAKTFQVANCGCQDVTVSLDANCQFVLAANLVSDSNCGGGRIQVMDNNPNNGNIIDCAGVWTYGLFDDFGNIICWGKVTAEDKTAPRFVNSDFYMGTLDCYDVNYVLNNPKTIGTVGETDSPKAAATSTQTILYAEGPNTNTAADDIKNLGYPNFQDNCKSCGCRVTLKWSDKVVYYSCADLETNGNIYAKIYREWVATDCNGMRSSVVQVIPFARPAVVLADPCAAKPSVTKQLVFRGDGKCGADASVAAPNYDWVVQYTSCTPDKSLIKKVDVMPSFRSYFYNSKTKRDIYLDEAECNYSVQIKDTDFPTCGGKGLKISREIFVFDWCAGGVIDTLHVLIKITDDKAPTLTPPAFVNGAPYTNPTDDQLYGPYISTGPMDCTAAFPITVAGIKKTFGYTIADNCSLGNVTMSVKTRDRYVKGILVSENNWDKVDYAIMNNSMIGLPTGWHRLIIDMSDGCYNASRDSFDFWVEDKIAPVMKCDDQLNVSLSNGNGYTTGYAQVTVEDLNEGSWDNCKIDWIKARRNVPAAAVASFIAKGYDSNNNGKLDAAVGNDINADGDYNDEINGVEEVLQDGADGIDINGDGDFTEFGETFVLKGGKLMTPLTDVVEFFCGDVAAKVTVELWAEDISDYENRSFCWEEILVEDKVAPACVAPFDLTIDCTEKCLEKIDNKAVSALCFGDVEITSGNDCAALDTVYTVSKDLKCGYGTIIRSWALTKQTAKGPITINCAQTITVLPRHNYNITFPKDAIANCKQPIVDTAIVDDLACDILAVNVSDKRYDASNDECYKIFRTYTVMNWCSYNDVCDDAVSLSAGSDAYVVDRGTFGNYGKAALNVLVRDENRVDSLGPEFWISKDLEVNKGDEHYTFYDELAMCPYNNLVAEYTYFQAFQYTQIIKVYDDVRPIVTGDAAKFCIRDGGDCLANLKMVINGTDNCSDAVTLETQFLMIAPNQTLDGSRMLMFDTKTWSTKDLGNGNFEINVKDLAAQGTHDLIVVVRDECGNLSVPTRIPFTIADCKGPAPICINGLSVDLMPDGANGGMMSVWATDFVASKVYDCNGQDASKGDPSGRPLITKYSLNRVGVKKDKNATGINLNCADNGKVILVELHAWDEAGNDDFCVTYVEVQDNRNVCPGSITGGSFNIAGTIATEGAAKLQGASISLSGAVSQSATTTANGAYAFVNLDKGGDFTISPQLDKNQLNGVSTFDLVLIQKHILNVVALNSPYKMIAADVNNSKSITTLDLIALRKLILNIDQSFQNNTSWRFVDATYQFPNASNPWAAAFPEVVSVNDLAANTTANFVAIKVGDVNASATVSAATAAEVRTNGTLNINAAEAALKAGQEYSVEFSAADLKNVQGYQFALNLDKSKVELVDIVYGVAKAENFGLFANEGIIATSWNQAGLATETAKQGALFTLVLRAKADAQLSSALSLNRIVAAEAYNSNNDQLGLALTFNKIAVANGFELKQNTPNPFNGETVIKFNLPKATAATLTIRDVTGRILKGVRATYAKGMNQVTLKASDLNASGVLYYTLEADNFTATKKMIVVE